MPFRKTVVEQNFTATAGFGAWYIAGTCANAAGASPLTSTSSTGSIGGQQGGVRFTYVDARFAVQDQSGLFTHADSLVADAVDISGIHFRIVYAGARTKFSLSHKGGGGAIKGDYTGVHFAEGEMPTWMSRGVSYDWRLGATDKGFSLLAKKTSDSAYRVILQIVHNSGTGTKRPAAGALATTLGPNRGRSGFWWGAVGVTCESLKVMVKPTVGDAHASQGYLQIFRDDFTLVSNPYLASNPGLGGGELDAFVPVAGPSGYLTTNGLTMAINTLQTNTQILSAGTNVPGAADEPCILYGLTGISGPVTIKIANPSGTRNIAANSNVSGTTQSVTITTNPAW